MEQKEAELKQKGYSGSADILAISAPDGAHHPGRNC